MDIVHGEEQILVALKDGAKLTHEELAHLTGFKKNTIKNKLILLVKAGKVVVAETRKILIGNRHYNQNTFSLPTEKPRQTTNPFLWRSYVSPFGSKKEESVHVHQGIQY